MSSRKLTIGLVSVAVVLICGCDRGEVTAYDIPKENPPAQVPAMSPSGADPHAGLQMSQPSLTWSSVPDGWTESPRESGMRLATFVLEGDDGQSAEMAIIPMGGFAGTDAQLVNMWRMQLGLPELSTTEAEGQGEAISIGGESGHVYEMTGNAQGVDTRMVVASVTRDGMNYFFKFIGNNDLVVAQKDAFANFLKGVRFEAAAPRSIASPQASAGGEPWTAPDGWEKLPATQFLLAKYRLAGEGDGSIEVTVSMLGGSAGGLLPNVNRWRGQLNLAPVDDAGLTALLSKVRAGDVDAVLVDLEGTDLKSGAPARMLTAVVAQPTETWFFKMTGPVALVAQKEAEFLQFVNSTTF